jgi:hypothetical protein
MTEAGMVPSQPQTLDDVMIAMDVVDTLRHREDLVRRELNEEGRESELIARLRQIYHDQGIEVPDKVLAEGVKALKDSCFVYTPAATRLEAHFAHLVGKTAAAWQAARHRRGSACCLVRRLLRARHATGQTCQGTGAHRNHRDAPETTSASLRR